MVKKGVILAAGEGTRLRPITKAIPKEMIRVGKKPTIGHVVEVLRHGGVEEVLVIVGRKKHAIIDYLGSGDEFGIDVYYRVQEEPKGTAHATALAETFIDHDDFALIYGDNYISPYNVMKEIVAFHKQKNGAGTLVLNPVNDPRRFGVVNLDDENKVRGIIEKPTLKEAQPYKRNDHWLNIAGLMILSSKIFTYIRKVEPGKNNELWLTDAIELMRKNKNDLYGYIYKGKRYDIGTFESLKKADELELERRKENSKNKKE